MLYASIFSLHFTLSLMLGLFVMFSFSNATLQNPDLYAACCVVVAVRAQINMRSGAAHTCREKGLYGLRRITECIFLK